MRFEAKSASLRNRQAGAVEQNQLRIDATIAEFIPDEEERRWVRPALLTLLGLAPTPAGGRDVLFAAWRIFFERVAERGTTVLLFEDLQWADSGLLDFIEYLLEWSRTSPILVVALARPEDFERRTDWGADARNLTRLALEPLTAKSMRGLLDGFVPGLPENAVAIVARPMGCPCTRWRRFDRLSPMAGLSAMGRSIERLGCWASYRSPRRCAA